MEPDDDTLALTLERIDSHVSLVRAAAVCKRWRRVIADAAFLRRYRSLHGPAVAGDYHNHNDSLSPYSFIYAEEKRCIGPIFVPASPSLDARHFALDFLPGMVDHPQRWKVVDSRGGLLLMHYWHFPDGPLMDGQFPDMTVCQPLTRRYRKIPAPADLNHTYAFLGSYLVDGNSAEEDTRIGIFNFRVVCLCFCSDFASATAMFTVDGDAGSSWSMKTIGLKMSSITGYDGGLPYFYTIAGALIVLDGSSGEFSSVLPSTEEWGMWNCISISECRDGKLRIFTMFDDNSVKVFTKLNDDKWALEKSAMLSELTEGLPGYQPSFFRHPAQIWTRGTGFVILSTVSTDPWFFSIHLDTMEAALARADMGRMVYRYELPWPPAFQA